MNTNLVKAALYTRLNGDATLDALITGVHDGLAPQGAVMPYVLFNRQSDERSYTIGQAVFDNQLWQIKAVTTGGDAAKTGGDIDARIDVLLTDQPLSITGGTNHVLRRVRAVDYPEILSGGQRVHHTGGIYQLVVGGP